jgi:hypothetical protein
VRGRGHQPARSAHGRGSGSASPPPAVTPEAQALLPKLLEISTDDDVAARFGTLANETPGGTAALIEVLGGSREEAAGPILAVLAASAPDREQRKSARRALHRLRSSGVALARPVPVEPPPPAAPVEFNPPTRALVSPSDGVGSRLLWLLIERPLGGMTTFSLAINDVVGLKNTLIEETTRRRFDRRLREWNEHNERWATEIPVEYGLALLSEALALNAESEFPLPRDFVIRRGMLGELPPPPADALIHQHISRGQTFLLPNLLEESAGLLDGEPELLGWVFSYDEISTFARDFRQAGESTLLLTSEPPERRQARIVGDALDALFTPALRRGYRRRLEETAYIFWQTGRERSARQAVAAAFAISDTGSVRNHPLLKAIVARSIELATEADRSGLPLPPGATRTAYTPSERL